MNFQRQQRSQTALFVIVVVMILMLLAVCSAHSHSATLSLIVFVPFFLFADLYLCQSKRVSLQNASLCRSPFNPLPSFQLPPPALA